MIAVKGRTVEIGTRRALGARIGDVFAQVLTESVLLSVLGCALGLWIGWQGTRLVAARASLSFEFDWTNAQLAVFTAALMNVSFAVLPAFRAAQVSPICALRHE